jgi:prephenate dehydratase
MIVKTNRIAFQGDFGANSDMACRDVYPLRRGRER